MWILVVGAVVTVWLDATRDDFPSGLIPLFALVAATVAFFLAFLTMPDKRLDGPEDWAKALGVVAVYFTLVASFLDQGLQAL